MKIRLIKLMTPMLAVGIAIAAILALILFFKPLHDDAQATGNAVGTSVGKFVGTAVGSYQGYTQDYGEGIKEGKKQGLSAEDTEITDISRIIRGTGDLQVLVAGVALDNFHEVGKKYAALYSLRGQAIFTVDLEQATIDEEQTTVMIPFPKVQFIIDETSVEKIAELKTTLFNGSTEDGYTEYMNSVNKIKEKTEEYIANYDELQIQAQEAAIEQVGMLVKNMTGKNVNILFQAGGEE